MKFTCNGCQQSFNVPDEKLPFGSKVNFPCPACKAQIELDLREKSGEKAAQVSAPPAEPGLTLEQAQDPDTIEKLKKKIMKNINDLPPMPQIVFKAHEIMDDSNSSTKQVADLIETDQAIATKVLKMANSAYYGMSGKVSSIQHASVVLGYKALGELITLAGTSSLMGNRLFGYDLESGDLWRHAMSVAFASKIIANKRIPSLENDAFSAGLIHDIGKLVFDRPVLNRKVLFDEYMEAGDKTFLAAERKILGFDHAEIGYEICCHWKIPDALAQTIRYHHNPGQSDEDELVTIVYMANTLANMAESMEMVGAIENSIDAMMYLIDDDAMTHLGLEEKDISGIITEVLDSVEKISQEMAPA